MSGELEVTEEHIKKILQLTRDNYNLINCVFPDNGDDYELVCYLYDSLHGAEINCLLGAINAHNVYNNDNMTDNEFYEWHGL